MSIAHRQTRLTARTLLKFTLLGFVIYFAVGACSTSGPERSSTLRLSRPAAEQVVLTGSDDGLACSVPGIADWLVSWSKSSSIVEQFRQACVQHDYCYRYGYATYGVTRSECDSDLRTHIRTLCTQIKKDWKQPCGLRASITYWGVRIGGSTSYRVDGFSHDYDSRPFVNRDITSAHSVRVASAESPRHELVVSVTGARPAITQWTWADKHFSLSKPVNSIEKDSSLLQLVANSEIPQVVSHGDGEVLAYMPSARALYEHRGNGSLRPGKLWSVIFNPSTGDFQGMESVAGSEIVGEEDTLHMPALVNDFDGDGSIELVYLGRSRDKHTPIGCQPVRDGRNEGGSRFLSVETLSFKSGCYSVSLLRGIAGVSKPRYEKYKKFQYPPIVGDLVPEAPGETRKLEILLVYRDKDFPDRITGWLLRQSRECAADATICWEGSLVSGEGWDLPMEFHPLVVVPALNGTFGDILMGVDWTENGQAAGRNRIEVRQIAIAKAAQGKQYEFVDRAGIAVDRALYRADDHSPISLFKSGNSRFGVFSQVLVKKKQSIASVVTLAFDELPGEKLRVNAFECGLSDNSGWVRFPQVLGDFTADGIVDLAFIDRTDVEKSVLFTLREDRFVPHGREAVRRCGAEKER